MTRFLAKTIVALVAPIIIVALVIQMVWYGFLEISGELYRQWRKM